MVYIRSLLKSGKKPKAGKYRKEEKFMSEQDKIKNKAKNKEKLTVRDFITMALFLVLVFIIYSAVGMPLGVLLPIYGAIFMHAVCALFWGTIFVLLYTKINKKWVPLSFSVMLSLILLMSAWYIVIPIVLGGIIAEIVWQKFDRKKFSTMTACFTIQITAWFSGIYIPLLMIADLSKLLKESYVEMYAGIIEALMGPLFLIAIVVTAICCIIGIFIGKALLKKHFEKAGIV